jgi:hypothetical protein
VQNAAQLDPVQAWRLGLIDTATLRDHFDDPTVVAEYGQVLADDRYALEQLAAASGSVGVV